VDTAGKQPTTKCHGVEASLSIQLSNCHTLLKRQIITSLLRFWKERFVGTYNEWSILVIVRTEVAAAAVSQNWSVTGFKHIPHKYCLLMSQINSFSRQEVSATVDNSIFACRLRLETIGYSSCVTISHVYAFLYVRYRHGYVLYTAMRHDV